MHFIRRATITSLLSLAMLIGISSFAHPVLADTVGQQQNFFVNEDYDILKRSNLNATLITTGEHAYWYVETAYLNTLFPSQYTALTNIINNLASEFDTNIYPKETQFWGSEAKPGIDNDPHITILLSRLTPNTGGYFDIANSLPRAEALESNQREMITVNVDSIVDSRAKIFLAHEFQHLISFNQKELTHDVSEEVWLNELRSQYAITVAGYNENVAVGDLRLRAGSFLTNPTDSLTEWPNTTLDYASVTLFGEYLVEHYGPGILQESLKSSFTSIGSIDAYLSAHGYSERFTDVFGNWMIANYLNDTSTNTLYGYTNQNLQTLRVQPTDNERIFYPSQSTFSYNIKPWQSYWLRFAFDSNQPTSRSLHIIDNDTASTFQMLYLDNLGQVRKFTHETYIVDPGKISWFLVMPINKSKTASFSGNEPATPLILTMDYVDRSLAVQPTVIDGALINHASAPGNNYVVEGKYKRYLSSAVIKLYGHLDPSKSILVPEADFEHYITSNYVRNVNDKKVYTVWPDGTKHWLNITAERFNESGRDWNSIFIINDLEFNSYKTGADITT